MTSMSVQQPCTCTCTAVFPQQLLLVSVEHPSPAHHHHHHGSGLQAALVPHHFPFNTCRPARSPSSNWLLHVTWQPSCRPPAHPLPCSPPSFKDPVLVAVQRVHTWGLMNEEWQHLLSCSSSVDPPIPTPPLCAKMPQTCTDSPQCSHAARQPCSSWTPPSSSETGNTSEHTQTSQIWTVYGRNQNGPQINLYEWRHASPFDCCLFEFFRKGENENNTTHLLHHTQTHTHTHTHSVRPLKASLLSKRMACYVKQTSLLPDKKNQGHRAPNRSAGPLTPPSPAQWMAGAL